VRVRARVRARARARVRARARARVRARARARARVRARVGARARAGAEPPGAELLLVEGERGDGSLLGVEYRVGVTARTAVGTAHQVDVLALERRGLTEELEHLVDDGGEGQAAHAEHAAVARVVAHGRAVAIARRLS
jgi:hypothetical protein